jgi:Heterokaryon incompatibility protein (HET)
MEFGAKEPYAALTYCWGRDERFITTALTIRQHMIRINFQDLPPSLQDAVLVTEKLGLSLLWVDALCVFQDDENDKASEVSQMPSVYSQATFTIAASRASWVGDGFLTERPALGKENPRKVFELPYRCPDGEMGSVVLVPRIQQSTEPLDRRAWALQERLLSPRVLEYGSLQTRWGCPQNERNNDLVDGWRARSVINDERSDDLFIQAFQTVLPRVIADGPSDTRPGPKDRLSEWHHLVEMYTHRALTLPTDRLPAISGIAERYARILRDEYVGGLWRSNLPQELLWTHSLFTELGVRSLEYQGPSWSWAEINGAVRFPHRRGIQKEFEVLECHVELLSKDARFGAVRSGYLKVRGYVRPAKWIRDSNSADTRRCDALRRGDLAGPDAKLAASMSIDSLENDFTRNQVEFVDASLLVVSESSNREIEGLVLRPLANENYSRLDFFHLFKSSLDMRTEESEESRSERYQGQLRWLCGLEP